jgi:hypothetical protein
MKDECTGQMPGRSPVEPRLGNKPKFGLQITSNIQHPTRFVEIFPLTPRFNAVNHEGEMGKTV